MVKESHPQYDMAIDEINYKNNNSKDSLNFVIFFINIKITYYDWCKIKVM